MKGESGTRLHVILSLDPEGDFERVIRMWFEVVWDRLGGVLRDQLAVHPLLVDDIRGPLGAGRIREVFPQVGMPWCQLLNFGGDYGNDVVAAHAMNPRSWSWFLTEVEDESYSSANLTGGFIEAKATGYNGAGPGRPNLHV